MNSGQRPVASEKQRQQLIYYIEIHLSSKTGQPMMAVRFSDMQGKSLCMAICPYFLPPLKKGFPGCRPPAWRFHWQFTKQAGGGWGRSRRGRLGGTGLSERGGPSKVFPSAIYLPPEAGGGWGRSRRGRPPRDRPLRKASPGGAGRVPLAALRQQIFRQANKPPTAIVTPYCNKLRL